MSESLAIYLLFCAYGAVIGYVSWNDEPDVGMLIGLVVASLVCILSERFAFCVWIWKVP